LKKTRKTLKAMANDHHGSDCMNLEATKLVTYMAFFRVAKVVAHHSKMKPCPWQRVDSSPLSRPSYPIIDATLAPALAMDAKTIKMLGVVLNLLNSMKESRVSVMATIERPAPVRSMVMRISICRELSSEPLVSLGGGCIVYDINDIRS
jgi:hypothetical protein